LPYPADQPALKPGEYSWQLHCRLPGPRFETEDALFTVLDAASAGRIRAEVVAAQALVPDGPTNLPLIAIYVEHRLYGPAATALRRALDADPQDATLRQMLVDVFTETKQTREREELLEAVKASTG